jgi:stress response protein SCP2
MAINLIKGQTIDLRKNDQGEEFDLSTVTLGLGWDVRQQSGGFFGKLFGGGGGQEYDLEANLGRKAQAPNGREVNLYGGDIIFFNSMQHPSGHIWLTGDNRTGAGDGDDEQIIVKLNSLGQQYQRILFLVSIYQGRQNNQHFGMVDNAFIRAVDARGKEIARYSLSGDSTFNGMCSMTFAELYRKDGSWKFRAIGEPHATDNFTELLKKYM